MYCFEQQKLGNLWKICLYGTTIYNMFYASIILKKHNSILFLTGY